MRKGRENYPKYIIRSMKFPLFLRLSSLLVFSAVFLSTFSLCFDTFVFNIYKTQHVTCFTYAIYQQVYIFKIWIIWKGCDNRTPAVTVSIKYWSASPPRNLTLRFFNYGPFKIVLNRTSLTNLVYMKLRFGVQMCIRDELRWVYFTSLLYVQNNRKLYQYSGQLNSHWKYY